MSKILAYRTNRIMKANFLALAVEHREKDRIAKGQYWNEHNKLFEACAVGCTIESYRIISGLDRFRHDDHTVYDEFLGDGGCMLGHLQDVIFEGLPYEEAMGWPEGFLAAIEPGADLSLVGWNFLHWLLTDDRTNPGNRYPSARDAFDLCAKMLARKARGEPVSLERARAASSAATAAAKGAWAERATHAAWAAEVAESASWAAVKVGDESGLAAAQTAREVAESVAWQPTEDRRPDPYVEMSQKLIELLQAAPIGPQTGGGGDA